MYSLPNSFIIWGYKFLVDWRDVLKNKDSSEYVAQLLYTPMSYTVCQIVYLQQKSKLKTSARTSSFKFVCVYGIQQLQEKLNEMNFELKSVQHTSWAQDHKIQNLSEVLKSKENEVCNVFTQ